MEGKEGFDLFCIPMCEIKMVEAYLEVVQSL